MAEVDDGLFLIDGEGAGSTPWEFSSIPAPEGTNVFALDAAAKNYGSYGYSVTFDGTNEGAYGIKTFAEQTDSFHRFYFYMPTGFNLSGTYTGLVIAALYDSITLCAAVRIQSQATSTPQKFGLTYDAATSIYTAGNSISPDTWYRLEVRFLSDGAAGGAALYINNDVVGSPDLADMDQDTSAMKPDSFRLGGVAGAAPGAGDVLYFDDLKADTSLVGVYADSGGSIVPLLSNYYRRLRG